MSETDLLNKIATLLENQQDDQRQTMKTIEDVLKKIAKSLEEQHEQKKQDWDVKDKQQRQKDVVQLYSGLSVIGGIIGSLSISLMTYAASLGTNNLSNETLFVLDCIWSVTAIISLFFAGATGIVAAIFGAVKSENLKQGDSRRWGWKSPRWSDSFVVTSLFLLLLAMIGGVVILANGLAINTPGSVVLPAKIIYPLVTIVLICMIVLIYWMVHTRYESFGSGPKHAGESS
ncbi:hypothetical protein BYT27DRAFT_7187703 [Phlegmacium glaucopus]|nr:hypothetical protein BYT27DRAFT_7187703 [Phlegmacium glaucopus]